jgi:uncharacterized small protein (DUF1192 family)
MGCAIEERDHRLAALQAEVERLRGEHNHLEVLLKDADAKRDEAQTAHSDACDRVKELAEIACKSVETVGIIYGIGGEKRHKLKTAIRAALRGAAPSKDTGCGIAVCATCNAAPCVCGAARQEEEGDGSPSS